MKTGVNESKNPLFKRLGFLGIGLCVLCCALPIIGGVVGMAALASLAVYLEQIAIAVLIASAGLLAFAYFSTNKTTKACTTSCDTSTGGSCNCKTEKTSTLS